MHYRQAPVWQNAMLLAEAACRLAATLPSQERYTVRPQIIRAAVSVASNIAEGWARESVREKSHFLAVAQGSLAELTTQLILCRRLGWGDPESFERIAALESDTGRMLTALRRHFRR
ncbi:four helix bundle protein [Arenimonas composti]|uniref:Four helix bundle protein n=1 Tax=Arenimonas composti TR7-09 = DSM 18010 TaxID=1121013 RepID=A0A091BIQ4_9GAMM|nr:four helix bundle protein [Arenimonas composti]KFN51392.1 hypothetical protein P873_03745 [Arenimonas composti TR7-09 = DSM 18010]